MNSNDHCYSLAKPMLAGCDLFPGYDAYTSVLQQAVLVTESCRTSAQYSIHKATSQTPQVTKVNPAPAACTARKEQELQKKICSHHQLSCLFSGKQPMRIAGES